jgi:hypothetical protein
MGAVLKEWGEGGKLLRVVPAKRGDSRARAGTHNHPPQLVSDAGVMGPRFRGDDE